MATNTSPTSQNHNGTGSQANFAISFPFLLNTEIEVTVDGNPKTLGTHYNIVGSQVQFTSGNIPASGTSNVVLNRNTNISTKTVDFEDGSVLTETDLDNNANQLLFSMQEIIGSGASSVSSVTGTTPILSSGGTTPIISISAATTSAAGSMSASDKTKLDGIEASATADQTNAEIKTAYEANSDTNAFTDADHSKLDGIEASADVTDATNVNAAGAVMNSDTSTAAMNFVVDEDNMSSNSNTKVPTQQSVKAYVDANAGGGSVNSVSGSAPIVSSGGTTPAISITAATTSAAGSMSSADKTKLDGIETSATADQTDAEIKTAYENNSDTNAFTDAEKTKLSGIETSATADQTAAEIRTLVESASDSNVFTDADHTKLNAVEANADVTDATNVNAAGAVMNSDLDGKGELLVGDGSGDPTALAAGINGYVLKANSSTATGLEWSAAGSGGDVNQNAFSNVAVSGQDTVAADSATDTLNIAAGSNVTITTNAGSDTVTISSTDTNTTYSVGDGGLSQNNFTDALKTKLDGIETSADVTDATNVASAGAVMDGDFTSNGFMKRTGAGSYTVDTNTYLTAVPSGYLQNVSEDSSPQLGANLDVQSNEITTSTSNGNIKLNPNGTGVVEIKGDGTSSGTVGTLQLNCSNNNHGVKIASPPHSAGASYTLTLPNTDGNANQVLKTDGSGGLDWVDQTTDTNTQLSNAEVRTAVEAASDSNVFTDADHSKLNAIEASATADQTASEIKTLLQSDKLTVNEIADDAITADKLANSINTEIAANTAKTSNATHTGEVTGSAALTIADNVVDEANLKVSNTPTDGYVLTAQSGNTGGLTWAAQSGGGGGVESDAQDNTVAGTNAGDSFDGTNAEGNTLFGKNAGTAITTGDQSTCVGKDAGKSISTGARLTAIGHRAGEDVTGQNNTIVGANAGLALTSGQGCTIVGTGAGDNYTSQSYITVIGNSAGGGTGANGTYVGYDAGGGNGNSAQNQTFVGKQAGRQSTGSNNTVLGSEALFTAHNGSNNVAIGSYALYSFSGSGTSGSIAVGGGSLYSQTSGNENVACGRSAGFSVTTGAQNTLLGNSAGQGTGALTTGDNNIIIGYGSLPSAVDVDNEITLGNSSNSSLRCNTQTISSLSDARDKTNVIDLPEGLKFINKLRPVKFEWATRDGNVKDGSEEHGFIAQDLQTVQKDNNADYLKIVMDNNPDRLEASYGKLIPILVKAIQELTIEVETLKSNG